MPERIRLKYKHVLDAVVTLRDVFELIQQYQHDTRLVQSLYDSKIQRFEYCCEEFWEFLSLYLERIHAVETRSSRAAFREARDLDMISSDEYELFIEMVIDRNKSSHGYNKFLSEKVRNKIPVYYDAIVVVMKRYEF